MNKSKFVWLWVAACVVLQIPSFVQAYDDEEETVGFDQIVNDLTRGQGQSRTQLQRSSDPFEGLLIHGGVGLVNNIQTLEFSNQTTHVSNQGVQATLGIDLFSDKWSAEGSLRSFGQSNQSQTKVQSREFDLKLVYRNRITPTFSVRAGAGLAARYLTVERNIEKAGTNLRPLITERYTTPASVAFAGMDMFLSSGFSIGAEASNRHTLIGSESPEKNAIDFTLRMDAHF